MSARPKLISLLDRVRRIVRTWAHSWTSMTFLSSSDTVVHFLIVSGGYVFLRELCILSISANTHRYTYTYIHTQECNDINNKSMKPFFFTCTYVLPTHDIHPNFEILELNRDVKVVVIKPVSNFKTLESKGIVMGVLLYHDVEEIRQDGRRGF